MCPQMLLTHFVVFRQNVEAVVWVSLGHSSLDSTGQHGWPESSRISVLLFRTRLNCSGCTRRAFPLSCPLGSLHPPGTDRTNRWIRVERSRTISILMLECAEIDVSTAWNLSPGQWLANTHSPTKAKSENSRYKITWNGKLLISDICYMESILWIPTSECAIRVKPALRRKGRWVREGDCVVVDVVGVDPNLTVGRHHIVADFCCMSSCPGDQWSIGVEP